MKHDEYLYKMWHTTWDQINENFETEQTLKTKVEGNIVSFGERSNLQILRLDVKTTPNFTFMKLT